MKPGCCLDIWDGDEIRSVVLLGADKGKLRVATAQGRELKIPEARVANEGLREMDPASAPSALGKLLTEHEKLLLARVAEVDLAALWEVLTDEGGSYLLADLSELALGTRDGDSRSVMLRRLVKDALYFSRRKLEFVPRTRDELGETLRKRSAEEEKTRRREEFVALGRAFLASGGGGELPAWPRGSERFLAALEDLAVRGLESDRIKEAMGLLEELGLAGRGEPPIAAFDVLVRFRVWGRDENLLLRKYEIQREFSPETLTEAERVASSGFPDRGRRDLRHLECHAIDDAETSEVDDALSLEERGAGRWCLGIHIADPGAFIAHGDRLDLEARARATTYYLPEERILMLPAALSERASSLTGGTERPALSFLVELDESGQVLGADLCASVIHVAARVTYENADRAIAAGSQALLPSDAATSPDSPAGEPGAGSGADGGLAAASCRRLAQMARLARALLARRGEAGALLLKGPDASVRVREGRIEIRRFEPWTPAWILVSEAMILANRLAAERLAAAGVPAIYRRQAAPDRKIELPAAYEPAAAAAARRALKRTEIGLKPGPHAGLGVPMYLQITSPLRRYQDLACQRQMIALLRGETPPFDTQSLWAVAQATDEAEKQARDVERDRREYWLLRHLEGLAPETPIDAIVTRTEDRRTLVELSEFVYIASIQPRPWHKPGRAVKVVVDAVVPRAGRLVLREIGGG